MHQLLTDENFNGRITNGILHSHPDIDIIRVQDVGLKGTSDPEILEWAADESRILLTHDRETIPDFVYERVLLGLHMPGIFLVDNNLPIGQAIDEIVLAVKCLSVEECTDNIHWFPLRKTN